MIVDLNWLEAAINNVSILVIILGSIPSIKDDKPRLIGSKLFIESNIADNTVFTGSTKSSLNVADSITFVSLIGNENGVNSATISPVIGFNKFVVSGYISLLYITSCRRSIGSVNGSIGIELPSIPAIGSGGISCSIYPPSKGTYRSVASVPTGGSISPLNIS